MADCALLHHYLMHHTLSGIPKLLLTNWWFREVERACSRSTCAGAAQTRRRSEETQPACCCRRQRATPNAALCPSQPTDPAADLIFTSSNSDQQFDSACPGRCSASEVVCSSVAVQAGRFLLAKQASVWELRATVCALLRSHRRYAAATGRRLRGRRRTRQLSRQASPAAGTASSGWLHSSGPSLAGNGSNPPGGDPPACSTRSGRTPRQHPSRPPQTAGDTGSLQHLGGI